MKTRSIAAAVLIAFTPAAILVAPVAHAQQPSDDDATVAARQRFTEGVEHYEKQRFGMARISFLQALQLKRTPTILLNLAWSCLKSNHPQEAEKYFVQVVREPNADGAKKADAQRGLDEARAKLGRIEIAAAAGTDVTLDNERVGVTPMDPLYVEPGAHTVKFGGGDAQMVSVLAGETKTARHASSSGLPPSATPALPRDTTHTTPAPTSTAPDTATPPSDTASAPSSVPQPETTADTGGKKTLFVPKDLTPVFVLGGISVASFVTAIAMGVVKGSAQSNADSVAKQIRDAGGVAGTCSSPVAAKFQKACSALQDNINTVNTDATVGNIAVGVGIGALVVAGIYWVASTKREKGAIASRPMLTPIVGPRFGGLSFGGQF